MGRHNHRKNRKPGIADRWDSDYIDLPEHPEISRIHTVPLKTVFHNIAAAPWAMEIYTAQSWSDPMMDIISRKI